MNGVFGRASATLHVEERFRIVRAALKHSRALLVQNPRGALGACVWLSKNSDGPFGLLKFTGRKGMNSQCSNSWHNKRVTCIWMSCEPVRPRMYSRKEDELMARAAGITWLSLSSRRRKVFQFDTTSQGCRISILGQSVFTFVF